MKNVRKIFSYLIMFLIVVIFIIFYNKYNFNNFDKNIRLKNATDFVRDGDIKYSKESSYKIENKEYNDAMFSQMITVVPNTPYRITCMIKTENVQEQETTGDGGAYIYINGTEESSIKLLSTNDWQEVSIMFNSKNETEINVGFRLGGNDTLVKGSAWFSDFKLEKGVASNSNVWNMACFIFPNINVDINIEGKNKNVQLQMSDDDILTLKTNLSRFKTSIREISNDKIIVNYESYIMNEPIESLSYDKENGYYVSASDVYEYINPYIEKNEYDHIYVAFRMADTQKGENVLENDWIGLGGMEYLGIGFSNIRMPDDSNNLIYEFNYDINTFPEEVFIHEFLHTLERNAKEYKYSIPELHGYSKYGYVEERKQGLKKWYTDYMNRTIEYNGEKIGIPNEIYTCKPIHKSNFKYAVKIPAFENPHGIIEIIESISNKIKKVFSN